MRRQFLGVAIVTLPRGEASHGTTGDADGGMPREMLIILDEE